ncbi:hypothetical protein B0G74_3035 [Paraburkholderia sp. BL9I2N2]|nr:hypothetical protein B0G74_3035 [Paraburkholderia sp. BL9I2N2]
MTSPCSTAPLASERAFSRRGPAQSFARKEKRRDAQSAQANERCLVTPPKTPVSGNSGRRGIVANNTSGYALSGDNAHALSADATAAAWRSAGFISGPSAGYGCECPHGFVRHFGFPTAADPKKASRITRLLNLSLFVERLIGYSPIFHVAKGAGAVRAFVGTLSGIFTLHRACAASKARAGPTRSNQYRRCFPLM